MAGKIQLQQAFQKKYELNLFIKDVLYPVFANRIVVYQNQVNETSQTNATETKIIKSVINYGHIDLDDDSKVKCYEIILKPGVRLEYNKVSIQQYVRKLLTAGQAVLVNFYQPDETRLWRLSLVASDSKIVDEEIQQVKTNAKRYTYLLGPSETCRTASDRFAELEALKDINLDTLIKAFSVEKLSKSFFDEYKLHYSAFNSYLINSNFRSSVFSIEKQKDETAAEYKPIRDFVKKMLGRIVFLYFVQKKGWLAASNTEYTDGDTGFMMNLFLKSGGNESFYPNYLCGLFFEALNKERKDDIFTLSFGEGKGQAVCIPFLNGGLFEKEKFDNKTLTFPGKLFHNKANDEDPKHRGFLDFLNAYNFTIYEDSPDDHTVAVDPEMLGHIFENLLEDNKDKGAYYTPKEIVHYMCQESLIEYLTTKLNVFEVPLGYTDKGLKTDKPKSKPSQLTLTQTDIRDNIKRQEIEDFVKNKNANEFIFENAKAIDEYLDTVKICDPAIGSGAFPMGLMQEIFALKMVLHDFVFATSNELFHLKDYDPKNYRSNVKLNIIQNSIYGVDIEKGAVDIARLRFWLSLIVDEQLPKALPNLDYKIVTGNSLVSKFDDEVIDIDWEVKAGTEATKKLQKQIHDNLEKLLATQKEFFNRKGDKQKLQAEIRELKIEVLISQLQLDKYKYGEKTITTATLFEQTAKEKKKNTETTLRLAGYNNAIKKLEKLKTQPDKPLNFFDWKLDFPEIMNPLLKENGGLNEAGFDIVIGNPPYVRQEQISTDLKAALEKYFSSYNGRADLYVYFYELAINLTRKFGQVIIISSNKFFRAKYGESLRNNLYSSLTINQIIDFGELPVFQTASTFPMIFSAKKENGNYDSIQFTQVESLDYPYPNIKKLVEQFSIIIPSNSLKNTTWIFVKNKNAEILEKLKTSSVLLKTNPNYPIYSGIKTGFNDAFWIDGLTRNQLIKEDPNSKYIIKRLCRGDDIRKWHIRKNNLFIIYTHSGINIAHYPAIKSYLNQYKKRLENRAASQPWWQLQQAQYRNGIWEKPKIVYPDICKESRFTFDEKGIYSDMKGFIIPSSDLVLLGILNSNLIWWFLKQTAAVLGDPNAGGRLQLKRQYVENIPICKVPEKNRKEIKSWVEKCLSSKEEDNDALTEKIEQKINLIVYKLYNLTYAEVKLIDPEFPLTEKEYQAIEI